ncbi:MAG: FAD:protein FMN transferase, partial [Acidimicrobiales bacterium]
LDGIARGLALRWASRALKGTHHLLEVGGDCYGAGRGPDGAPWRIGVHDPLEIGAPSPLAVLALSDAACATASAHAVRASGQLTGGGLLSVTVLGPDPVTTAVWSRVLLLAGASAIAEAAGRRRLAACWVTDDGSLRLSPALEPSVLWRH